MKVGPEHRTKRTSYFMKYNLVNVSYRQDRNYDDDCDDILYLHSII